MPDILFPETIPQGSAAQFGTPAAPAPDTTSPATPQQAAGGGGGKHDGGKKGGLGGFLQGPIGQILLPILAGGIGAATGGLAFPALWIGSAALGEALGGFAGGALESGIVNKSPLAALTGG